MIFCKAHIYHQNVDISNELSFWSVYGIMNTLGLLVWETFPSVQ